MSLRDTFIRVNRHRGSDPRTAGLDTAAWAVLTQVWAIAADEGERDGEDVVVTASSLTPERVVLELPRSETVERVGAMMAAIERAGCFSTVANTVRVHMLATYNRDRFRQREARKRGRERVKPVANGDHTFPGGGAVAVAVAGAVAGAVVEQQLHGRHAGQHDCPPAGDVSNEHQPKPPKRKRAFHPDAVRIADAMAAAIKTLDPDARPKTHTAGSLDALGAVVRKDARDPDDALALVAWLYLGGYKARSADFDWSGICRTGQSLRKNWDALQGLRRKGDYYASRTSTTLAESARAVREVFGDD